MSVSGVIDSGLRRAAVRAETGLYVQFGCGLCAPEGWLNFDSSYTLRFERLPLAGKLYTKNASRFPPNVQYGNVVKGLPVADGSCNGIYASHVLEHLTFEDCRAALENSYRALRPGGILRLIVPDLETDANRYLRSLSSGLATAGEEFMESTALGRRRRPVGFFSALYSLLNTSAHLWMWDFPSMHRQLDQVGFIGVRRCQYNDSEDPHFALVEDSRRFEGALAIEARK